jgi:uncharacterized protein YutE (UPF0331/DUF86 family)
MRAYIDTRGRFKIDVPDHWNCREEDKRNGNPTTFMFGDDSEDCFQISCIPKNKGAFPEILRVRPFPKNEYSKSQLSFLQRNISTHEMGVTIFEAKVEDYFILALHTSSNKETDSRTIQNHLDGIVQSLKTLVAVDPAHWADVAAHARFKRFMISLLASIDLTNKAQEKGSSIELVILYANRIDALLRLALILQKQLEDSTDNIDITLIFQSETDQPIFEKSIYKQALAHKIIDEFLFEKLINLYDIRNRVVHRYIISDLKTDDIVRLVVDYMDIEEVIGNMVRVLEQEQFVKKIGIYGGENNPEDSISAEQMKGLLTDLHDKHANKQIIKEITIQIPEEKIKPGE